MFLWSLVLLKNWSNIFLDEYSIIKKPFWTVLGTENHQEILVDNVPRQEPNMQKCNFNIGISIFLALDKRSTILLDMQMIYILLRISKLYSLINKYKSRLVNRLKLLLYQLTSGDKTVNKIMWSWYCCFLEANLIPDYGCSMLQQLNTSHIIKYIFEKRILINQ